MANPKNIRRVHPGDAEALDRFFREHANTTMFLRGNLARGGFEYEGKGYQGVYLAAWEADRVVGVVGHSWRDSLMIEAPLDLLPALVRATLEESGRPASGVMGTCEQVKHVRRELGWQEAPAMLASEEILYHLSLDQLVVPPALETGEHLCRVPVEGDIELLSRWRADYAVEALGRSPEQGKALANPGAIRKEASAGDLFVIEVQGVLVAQTLFNTRTPDCVQVGGVWTPPEERCKGYARSAVAGSLLSAREGGATDSILFTEQTNYPAQACYEKLGYRVVGDYMLLHFQESQRA